MADGKPDGAFILMAEDSPTQSMLLEQVLKTAGYQVITAVDGLEAMRKLQNCQARLVITDITMPGMNGYQLCSAIRTDPRFKNLPVLLLTSLANEEEIILGLESGADAFIAKPFDADHLLVRVSDLLAAEAIAAKGEAQVNGVLLGGKLRAVNADHSRVLSYLISTYDSALLVNRRLAESEASLRDLNSVLEGKVQLRTAKLSAEMVIRKRAQDLVQTSNRFLEIANRSTNQASLAHDFLTEIITVSACAQADICLTSVDGIANGQYQPSTQLAPRMDIIFGNEVFGHIYISDADRKGIAEDTISILEGAAVQLATALHRIGVVQALSDSEKRFWQYFEDDLAGALILAPDGRIDNCNPAFSRIFGFSGQAAAIGSNILDCYRTPGEWQDFLALLIRNGKIDSREMEYLRPDGSKVFVIGSAAVDLDAKGAIRQIRQYLVDITEKKSLEQQLFQSQKMEAIGRLAGGVAHDFNNILQVIQGFSDYLLTKTPDEDPRSNWIKQIRLASDKAADLVQNLLTFSRKTVHSKAILDLNIVLHELDPMIRQLIGNEVKLTIDLQNGHGKIDADRSQIDKMILNLAANARDAMPDGGELTIQTENIELTSQLTGLGGEIVNPGAYLELRIRDNGNGMDSSVQAHLFEPFFTTKPIGKGTGLGLATVYGVVKQSGGAILCKSAPGEGTEFKILLPRTSGETE